MATVSDPELNFNPNLTYNLVPGSTAMSPVPSARRLVQLHSGRVGLGATDIGSFTRHTVGMSRIGERREIRNGGF